MGLARAILGGMGWLNVVVVAVAVVGALYGLKALDDSLQRKHTGVAPTPPGPPPPRPAAPSQAPAPALKPEPRKPALKQPAPAAKAEPKKPNAKKPESKKPESKKPESKKPEPKKPKAKKPPPAEESTPKGVEKGTARAEPKGVEKGTSKPKAKAKAAPAPKAPKATATDFFDPPPPPEEEIGDETPTSNPTGARLQEILSQLDEESADVHSTAGRTGDPGSLSAVPPAEDEAAEHLAELRRALDAGETPNSVVVEALAEDPITRRPIYAVLKSMKMASLIPQRLRTRKAMAEADMVTWIAESELAAIAEAIEQIEVFSKGGTDWYLFRFDAGRGPMAGISGAWRRADGPGGTPSGDTGSDLSPWSNDSEARVRALMEAHGTS